MWFCPLPKLSLTYVSSRTLLPVPRGGGPAHQLHQLRVRPVWDRGRRLDPVPLPAGLRVPVRPRRPGLPSPGGTPPPAVSDLTARRSPRALPSLPLPKFSFTLPFAARPPGPTWDPPLFPSPQSLRVQPPSSTCLPLLGASIRFSLHQKVLISQEFPGGPVVRSPRFHGRGHRFNPWFRSHMPWGVAQKKSSDLIWLLPPPLLPWASSVTFLLSQKRFFF